MNWRIGELLIQKKLINWDQLNEVLEEQQKTRELTGEILVRKGYVAKHLLYRALAEQNNVRYVDLKTTRINPRAVEKIPASLARKYAIIPIEFHHDILILGITSLVQTWPEKEIRDIAGVSRLQPVLCLPEEIHEAINICYA